MLHKEWDVYPYIVHLPGFGIGIFAGCFLPLVIFPKLNLHYIVCLERCAIQLFIFGAMFKEHMAVTFPFTLYAFSLMHTVFLLFFTLVCVHQKRPSLLE